jgi:hypothetical protein
MERWIWAGVWTLIGFPLCLWGKKWWGLFGPLLGALAGIMIGNFIEGQATNLIHSDKAGVLETWSWIFFTVTIALAGILAIVFACAKTAVGSLVGGTIGFLSTNCILSAIASMNDGYPLAWWAQWIIMAILVFTGVIIFYDDLIRRKIIDGYGDTFENRLVYRLKQVYLAIDVLETNDFLTDFGKSILSIMKESLEKIQNDYPAFKRPHEDIDNHVFKFSNKNFIFK